MIYPATPEDRNELDAWITARREQQRAEETDRIDALDREKTLQDLAEAGELEGRRLFLVGSTRPPVLRIIPRGFR